jgi:radical SAM superfamily enzyme YgiQ (UPF0313 family)
MQGNYSFEQGPIRPPSEAKSLLIRATRNCPWNKCAFCHTYRNTKYEMRYVEEIINDIQKAKDIRKDMIDQYSTRTRDRMNKDLLKIMNRYIQ